MVANRKSNYLTRNTEASHAATAWNFIRAHGHDPAPIETLTAVTNANALYLPLLTMNNCDSMVNMKRYDHALPVAAVAITLSTNLKKVSRRAADWLSRSTRERQRSC